jgi:hypothetical protein
MGRIRLVCWDEDTARERSGSLAAAGFDVDASPLSPSGLIRNFRENPPDAVVIDLDRLPSRGREVAVALRTSKATRHIPLVLAGGVKEKVAPIRREIPDAVFSAWEGMPRALRRAIQSVPANPVRPPAHMDRYAGSSLAKKLGIREHTLLALLNAPPQFEDLLGEIPEGAVISRTLSSSSTLILWFVRSRRELESETPLLAARLPAAAGFWIVHPKQSGAMRVDFNQNDVRSVALAAGLVDYKVCSVDSIWSGLKFARRWDPLSTSRSKR